MVRREIKYENKQKEKILKNKRIADKRLLCTALRIIVISMNT